MYAGSHFIVYVDVELFGNLQRRSECVRDLVVKGAGARSAAHLNFETLAVNEHTSFVAFENFVLQCSTLSCLPVCLLPLYPQRRLRRGKPEICPPPTLVPRIDRRQPGESDCQPPISSQAVQRRRQWKTVNVRIVLTERSGAESCHTSCRTFSYSVDVYRAVAKQPRNVFPELPAVVPVLQDVG